MHNLISYLGFFYWFQNFKVSVYLVIGEVKPRIPKTKSMVLGERIVSLSGM